MSTTLQANMRTATMEGHEPITVVELSGSIDPATLEKLEAAMDRCMADKKRRVVFDLAELRYINSTGMGMMVQFSDACRDAGGTLALMRIQPKVLLVIEMLGLQELFHIVDGEAEAFAAIDGVGPVPGGSASAEAAPSSGPAAAAAAEPLTGSMGDAAEGTPCPSCQAPLLVPSSGRYRCPRCLSALEVEGGSVKAYAEDTDRVAELWLPPHGDFLDSVKGLVAKAGHRSGLAPAAADKAAEAATSCWKKLAAMLLRCAAKGDRRLRVLVKAADGKLVVRTHCGGDALEKDAFATEKAMVDRLEYVVTAQGNLLMLEKSK